MARSITINPPAELRELRVKCIHCNVDLPVTKMRFTLLSITLECECGPCRTVHAREFSLIGRSVKELMSLSFLRADARDAEDAAFDRVFGGAE
jgi:hypothetical protein